MNAITTIAALHLAQVNAFNCNDLASYCTLPSGCVGQDASAIT